MANPSRAVLLTGAGGGLGRVMTQALLADGHKVAAVDREYGSLERLKALTAGSDRLHVIHADLTQEAACLRAVEAARARFGTVEAVINNAGIGQSSIRPDAEVRHPGIEELTPPIYERFFGHERRFGSEGARANFERRRARYAELFEKGTLVFEAGASDIAGAPVNPIVRLYRIAP